MKTIKKRSRLLARASWATIFFYIFFLNVSIYSGYYNAADFIYWNLGFGAAVILFITLYIGFKRYEFRNDVSKAVRLYMNAKQFERRSN